MDDGETSFYKSLSIQWRVICALLRREIITRYGRHNIGFFWLFLDPLFFCTGVVLIWLSLHHEARALPVVTFCITGYSTVLLWRNCGNKCSMAITPNLSLLYHRNVRVIDVLASRVILEISGCAMAFLVIVGTLCLVGAIKPPEDWVLLMWGYLLMSWYAASLSIVVCALTELSEVFEKIWHPITYFMLPISGLTFMVEWLPPGIQKIAERVPMINGTEMIRAGYFGSAVHPHYSAPYLVCWCMGLMLFGLTFLKYFARRVEPT